MNNAHRIHTLVETYEIPAATAKLALLQDYSDRYSQPIDSALIDLADLAIENTLSHAYEDEKLARLKARQQALLATPL